jgi:hypothetical protein
MEWKDGKVAIYELLSKTPRNVTVVANGSKKMVLSKKG